METYTKAVNSALPNRAYPEFEFQDIALTIKGKFKEGDQSATAADLILNELEVSAVEGIGTGLAYHFSVEYLSEETVEAEKGELATEDEEENTIKTWGYVLTQLSSGKCLGQQTVETVRQARLWLELVAPLADWRQVELATLIASVKPSKVTTPSRANIAPHRLAKSLEALAAQVEAARREAIVRCSYSEEHT